MEEKDKKEVEIDLLELGQKLLANKRFVIKVTIIGAIVGLVIAFSMPKEYTSIVAFTTDSNKSSSGNMGALASLAGINLNPQSSDTFSPELFPSIVNSTSFIQGLLDIKIKDSSREVDATVYSYLKDGQKSTWWNYILRAPGLFISLFSKSDQSLETVNTTNKHFISNEEIEIINALKSSYSINTEKKTGVTTFEITSQSPEIAAFLADTITSYLQSYIIQERTRKSQTDLENSRKLHIQYKDNYDNAQQKLASFIDRNKNIISESYRSNQRKLELEANLAYSIYDQMAKQVQMNEIKVQDDTPVFTIIQPAIEPLFPSNPKKKIILVTFVLLSLLGACGWILGREYIKQFKNDIKIQ